jgi:amino acid transporter
MLRHEFFVPLLGILGLQGAADYFAWNPNAWFIVSLITVAYVALIITLGMRSYARVQKICFWVGMAGLAIVFVFLLFGSHDSFRAGLDAQAPEMFGAGETAGGSVYEATLAAGEEAGAVMPMVGGGLAAVFLAMPYIVFFNLWPNWGATLYGEVKGADDFKRNMLGMGGALIVTTILAVIFFLLINKTITWDFYSKANGAYWNYRWGFTEQAPPLNFWPYPAMLTMFLTSSRIIQFIVILAMSMWFFGWAGTVFLSSTRVIFAAAFDRVLPEAVATVHPRTRTPIWAMVLMVIPGLIVSILYVWNIANFQSLTLMSTLVIAITYLGSTISAIILPYTKKEMYEASPIAKYKVLGIPLITVAGVIFAAFLIFLLYQWLVDPNGLYGIGLSNTSSLVFMLAMYGIAMIIYVVARYYRRSRGVSLDMLYKEIPAE